MLWGRRCKLAIPGFCYSTSPLCAVWAWGCPTYSPDEPGTCIGSILCGNPLVVLCPNISGTPLAWPVCSPRTCLTCNNCIGSKPPISPSTSCSLWFWRVTPPMSCPMHMPAACPDYLSLTCSTSALTWHPWHSTTCTPLIWFLASACASLGILACSSHATMSWQPLSLQTLSMQALTWQSLTCIATSTSMTLTSKITWFWP